MYGANNYGYSPYNRYIPQQPMQQPIQPQQIIPVQQNNLNGKQVESIEVVKAMDIPMDGTVSYFPIADGSAIVTKQLQIDGTSKTVVYKPSEANAKTPKYITSEELENALKEIDLSDVEDLKDELKDIKADIKALKKKKKDD